MESLLKACDQTRAWKSRAGTSNSRPSGLRDTAILLTLMDTGVRASELVNLRCCGFTFGRDLRRSETRR